MAWQMFPCWGATRHIMKFSEILKDALPAQRRKILSLPIALIAALVLVAINELGHMRSLDAVQQITHGQEIHGALNRLLQSMLDAETGQRGYLLTGNDRYLEPYDKALTNIERDLDGLRIKLTDKADMTELSQLSNQISRKLAEMELSVKLRRQGNEDAWKFILYTDVGMQNMQAVRKHGQVLVDRAALVVRQGEEQVTRSLMLSRLGIATVTTFGLLAFWMYLRQTTALQEYSEREHLLLERERDRLEGLVRDRTATLSELASHLQQVREEERAHLARELHDELGALLTAAKLDVARLKSKLTGESPEATARLHHLTDTLNSGIALKRRIIEDLRPSSLSNLGLTPAIEILTKEYSERAAIEVETSLEPVQLPASSQLTVYRLVQEALTNIGKYAKAERVFVAVHSHPKHVEVSVRDDGEGFDPSTIKTSSHGLAGMRHRVEAAGGRLTITSKPNKGTLILAVLPQGDESN